MSKLCVIKCYEFVICVPCFRCFFRGQVPGCLPIISHPYAGHSSGQGINQAGARATASPPFPFRHIFHNIRHYGLHRRTMLRMRNISYAPYSPDAAPSPSQRASCHLNFIFYFSGNHKGAAPKSQRPPHSAIPFRQWKWLARLAGGLLRGPLIEFGLRMKSHKESAVASIRLPLSQRSGQSFKAA